MEPQESLLLSLAPELTQVIGDELDTDSVKQLRLTCKRLAESLNGQILRTLTIDISKNNMEKGLSKLAMLARSNHAAGQATRELSIKSLWPGYDPSYQGPVHKYVGGEWISDPEPEDPPEVTLVEEEMKEYLLKAVASLKGVQTVYWTPFQKDREWAHIAVMDALKDLPNLRGFYSGITNFKIALAIDSLQCLRVISLEGSSEEYDDDIYDNLAKAIAKSSQLTSVDVRNTSYYFNPRTQSLHQLFKYYPPNAAPLRLRRLGLNTCLVRLDEVTLPHLTHLTSLELMYIEDPYSQFPHASEPEDDTRAAEKIRYGSSLEEIWKALRSAAIRLEEVTTDVVTQSFLEYLSSFSGIKKLHLSPGGFSEGPSSDAMAEQFFAGPFDNHCQSLIDLSIAALFEGLWCFSGHNLSAISKCTNLKSLRMAIISSQLLSEDDPAKAAPNSDAIKLLIDTAITYMPQIRKLDVIATNLEQLRRARCGNPAMSHLARVGEKMVSSVNNYTAPSSCQRLPSLFIGSRSSSPFNDVNSFIGNSENPNAQRPLRYVSKFPSEDRKVFSYY